MEQSNGANNAPQINAQNCSNARDSNNQQDITADKQVYICANEGSLENETDHTNETNKAPQINGQNGK